MTLRASKMWKTHKMLIFCTIFAAKIKPRFCCFSGKSRFIGLYGTIKLRKIVKNVKFFVLRFFHASFLLETKKHGRDPIRLQLRADRPKKKVSAFVQSTLKFLPNLKQYGHFLQFECISQGVSQNCSKTSRSR